MCQNTVMYFSPTVTTIGQPHVSWNMAIVVVVWQYMELSSGSCTTREVC